MHRTLHLRDVSQKWDESEANEKLTLLRIHFGEPDDLLL
jgi:hypothetical protein